MAGLGRHYKVTYAQGADGRTVLAEPRDPGAEVVLPPIGQRVNVLTHTGSFTLTKYDSGTTHLMGATTARVATLPATVLGLRYTFISSAYSSTYAMAVSPAAADKIMGNGFTATDNKDAINTLATSREGDSITLVGDGADGWYIERVLGTWARE